VSRRVIGEGVVLTGGADRGKADDVPGDFRAFCDELRSKAVDFPVALKNGVGGSLLSYVAAPRRRQH